MHAAAATQAGYLLDERRRDKLMVFAPLLDLCCTLAEVSEVAVGIGLQMLLGHTAVRTRQSSAVRYRMEWMSSFIFKQWWEEIWLSRDAVSVVRDQARGS